VVAVQVLPGVAGVETLGMKVGQFNRRAWGGGDAVGDSAGDAVGQGVGVGV